LTTFVRALQVALALGLLIFVHELGHFLAAKWAGVRVEVFSFGFGPFLLSFRKGDTVYALSLIPFGGYVRMTGQADVGRVKEEDKRPPYSYMAKSPAKRGLIIAAGVVMNAAFAYLAFVFAYMVGFPEVPSELGPVAPGSPADRAGLREGDRVVEIDGRSVDRFNALYHTVATSGAGEPIRLLVKRDGHLLEPVTVVPVRDEGQGIATIGVERPKEKLRLRVGAENARGLGVLKVYEDTPAETAGLRKTDFVEAVDGVPFDGLAAFKKLIQQSGDREVRLSVRRQGRPLELRVTPTLERTSSGESEYRLGFRPTEFTVFVGSVAPGSQAHEAGIEPWAVVTEVVRSLDDDKVELAWRNPGGKEGRAKFDRTDEGPFLTVVALKQEIFKSGFLGSWHGAAKECVTSVGMTYGALWGLLTRRVPLREMSGPVSIVAITYHSTKPGWGYYLWLVAFISVNLAVINLFPMLPLDGGLLAFLIYEGLRGRPANQRVQEIVQIVGVALLLALVIYITQNDIARHFFPG
jgi:regulator of sigma E protease